MKFNCDNQEQHVFFKDTRKQVNVHFKENCISMHANSYMIFKTVFYLGSFVSLYIAIITLQFNLYSTLLLVILIGVVQACIGFNICHDAMHGSYSSNKTVNRLLSYIFDVFGANSYIWRMYHNKLHHIYTNIPGLDKDIDVAPGIIRLSPSGKYHSIMRFQHYYALILYMLTSLSVVFRNDFKKFFLEKELNGKKNVHPIIEYYKLFFFKFIYITLFIIIPLLSMNITLWQFLFGFLLMHMAEGLALGIVFQLAHIMSNVEYPELDPEGHIKMFWAIHQMHTTTNFSMQNPIIMFLFGGLNHQIEHHLFPKICHVHYPVIAKIVRQSANKYNVPYHENRTFIDALSSHFRILKHFGKNDKKY